MKLLFKVFINLALNLLVITGISYMIYAQNDASIQGRSIDSYFSFISTIAHLNFWLDTQERWFINLNILSTLELTFIGIFSAIIIALICAAYTSFSNNRFSKLVKIFILVLRPFPIVILMTLGFSYISNTPWFGTSNQITSPELITHFLENGYQWWEIIIKLFLTSLIAGYFAIAEFYLAYRRFIIAKLEKPNIKAVINSWSGTKIFFVTMLKPLILLSLIHLPRIGAILLGLNIIIEYFFHWLGIGDLLIKSLIYNQTAVTAYIILVLGVLIVLFNNLIRIIRFLLDPYSRMLTNNEL